MRIFTQPEIDLACSLYTSGKKTSEEIGGILHTRQSTARKLLRDNGIHVPSHSKTVFRRKYNLDDNYFETIDTPAKAYLLGVLFADGFVADKSNTTVSYTHLTLPTIYSV